MQGNRRHQNTLYEFTVRYLSVLHALSYWSRLYQSNKFSGPGFISAPFNCKVIFPKSIHLIELKKRNALIIDVLGQTF